ncbi:MAG: hypothetical protein NC310_01965 [Roseburia sp.]|nr:hypothetical protein [Roseburia sp.]MCM1556291.1 hypothetical protein [Anaeroplasma bactoclasticum]
MNGIMKMIFPKGSNTSDKSFFCDSRNNLSASIDESVTKAFEGIIASLGSENFNSDIRNYNLLESFIFSNLAKPKYQQGDYVVIKNEFVELVPNKELYVQIASTILDDNKCEILYSVNYRMDNEYQFKVIKESAVLQKQETDFTNDNFYGRDDLERLQYLQMKRRTNGLVED